jgi:hypothetical protein
MEEIEKMKTMEVKEFVKKYLPDYEVRIKKYRQEEFRDEPIRWAIEGETCFCMKNFAEALKIYTENCVNRNYNLFNDK